MTDKLNFGVDRGDIFLFNEKSQMTFLTKITEGLRVVEPDTGMPPVISEGEKWVVHDILDARDLIVFSDWDCVDPEGRAREFFDSYPRPARLYRQHVVKFERELVAQDMWHDEENQLKGVDFNG